MGRREAELAARLLLQGRGGEGRIGIAPRRPRLDIGDGEGRRLQRLLEGFRVGARPDVEALDLLPVGADEARLEGLRPRRRERRHQRPVFAGDEFFDLELAVADEPQRDRLHAPRRLRPRQLAPQHRRQREADEIVERAAGEIGVDQRLVDLAGMLHRLRHRLLGDGVEDDPFDLLVLDGPFLPQRLEDMPGDRLALAVGVGGENQLVGALDGGRDAVQTLLRLGIDFPKHVEIVLGIDRSVLGRKVPHMPERSKNLIATAEISVDRLGLGGGFDDDYVHEIPLLFVVFNRFSSRALATVAREHG